MSGESPREEKISVRNCEVGAALPGHTTARGIIGTAAATALTPTQQLS